LTRVAPRDALEGESARWKWWQKRRLQAMIDYATDDTRCRRTVIGDHFGDAVEDCKNRDVELCDVCSGEPAPWSAIPDHKVADPELLVNAELTALQAIAWASAFRRGAYGEASLKAAVLGRESLGDNRPLGAGDRKSTRLNSSHVKISYAVFCL